MNVTAEINKSDYNKDWSGYFRVDETSPSGLVRIKNRVGKDIEKYNVGNRNFKKNGNAESWVVWFQGKHHLIHRVIWIIVYGSIDPELVIDHLDGDPFNNKVSNLSLKTAVNNARNKRKYSNNISGITGIMLRERKGKLSYVVQWCDIRGTLKQKWFSLNKFGEDAKTMALLYREEQIELLIQEGAEYTDRHGI